MEPLVQMGARITGQNDMYPPLRISKSQGLEGIAWKSPVSSAQVKSCLLLAGLYASGETSVEEPVKSRDHTERMLAHFGVSLVQEGNLVRIKPLSAPFQGANVTVPGDLSSAAFFLMAAALVPSGRIRVTDVGVNPTRTGFLKVLEQMGVPVKRVSAKVVSNEPVADLEVTQTALKAFSLGSSDIPALVDEIPILAVAATQAQGESVISGAQELRVKETDRLKALSQELGKMGAQITEKSDGLIIRGPIRLKGARVQSHGDHRMAMSLAVAGLLAQGESVVEDVACVETSFPGFWNLLSSVRAS